MTLSKARETAQEAKTAVYRSAVLEAAERHFAEHGYETAKMQAIADDVGLSVGTVYGIFPSKADLFDAIHTEHIGAIIEGARRAGLAQKTAVDALDAAIATYVRYLAAHPDYLRIQVREGRSWAQGPLLRTGRQYTAWREALDLQAALVRQAIADGAIVDADAMMLTKIMTVMVQVALADWVEGGMKQPVEGVVEALRSLFRRTVFRG